MENKIKVSVIVPVYNVEQYLEKCLDSLVRQTLNEIEIIVVDDGSQDNSRKIAEEFREKYPNKVYFFYKENEGLGEARNFGLDYAKGEYIGFVDSDDWVDEKTFQAMYETARNEDADVVVCDFISIYDGWRDGWVSKGYRGAAEFPEKRDWILNAINPATACNKLFRKSLFSIARFPKGWYEDIATTPILLSYSRKIFYLSLPLYYYRIRNNSITTIKNNKHTLDVINAWDNLIKNTNKYYYEEIIGAIYYSIIEFINFKSEFADDFIAYAKKKKELFEDNVYVKNGIKEGKVENIFEKTLIPKIIHYFWFGNNKKDDLILKCLDSWKKYAPDYKIIEWNESNCDITECDYVKEAYQQKKWAFVADYFRIKKIYEYGGIYLDTDMELMDNISKLRLNKVFFAFETKTGINAAIFGAVPRHFLIKQWLDTYALSHLKKKNGELDTSNTIVVRLTKLLNNNFKISFDGKEQILSGDIKIYAPNVLTLNMFDGKCIAQHHYEASWWDVKAGVTSYKYEVLKDYFKTIIYTTNNDSNENTYKDLVFEINNLKKQIYNYETSTCWKITKPLRCIVNFLRKNK